MLGWISARLKRRKSKIAVALILIVLIGPFLVPVPPLKDTVPPLELADPDSLFADVNGISVHYKMRGSGKPAIVLLHGFGASLFSWREVLLPLAQNHTVVAFDRPAFGLTERPLRGDWVGENPYTAEAQVRLTFSLMDRLGIEKAVIVGHSAGSAIALLAALEFPARVQALVLVDPALGSGHGGSLIRALCSVPQIRRLAPLFVRSIRSWGKRILVRSWHNSSRITEEIMAGYTKPLRAKDWDLGLLEFALAARPTKIREKLSSIALPVLVVTGDDDRVVAPEESARLAQEMPNARLAVIPRCGHIPQEECPLAFLEAVQDFLRRLPCVP